MTPHILSLKEKGNKIIELSEGTGIDDKPIFGVTVIQQIDGDDFQSITNMDWNKMFHSKPEAINHIEKLLKVI